jgi:hypothetical protein
MLGNLIRKMVRGSLNLVIIWICIYAVIGMLAVAMLLLVTARERPSFFFSDTQVRR